MLVTILWVGISELGEPESPGHEHFWAARAVVNGRTGTSMWSQSQNPNITYITDLSYMWATVVLCGWKSSPRAFTYWWKERVSCVKSLNHTKKKPTPKLSYALKAMQSLRFSLGSWKWKGILKFSSKFLPSTFVFIFLIIMREEIDSFVQFDLRLRWWLSGYQYNQVPHN